MNESTPALDAATIASHLPPLLRGALPIECVAQIDSTNAELLRRGSMQECLAFDRDTQNAGRDSRRSGSRHPGPFFFRDATFRYRDDG